MRCGIQSSLLFAQRTLVTAPDSCLLRQPTGKKKKKKKTRTAVAWCVRSRAERCGVGLRSKLSECFVDFSGGIRLLTAQTQTPHKSQECAQSTHTSLVRSPAARIAFRRSGESNGGKFRVPGCAFQSGAPQRPPATRSHSSNLI